MIAAAVALVLATTAAGVFGPGLARRASEIWGPISKMRSAQQDFEAWSKAQGWHEPAEPNLTADRLDVFLALRKELQKLEEEAPRPRREPGDPRPGLRNVPRIVSGVSGFVSARLEAFKRSGMTNAEYRYLEQLVYRRWLAALRAGGQDPAVLEQVSEEILNAVRDEPSAPTATRLRALAEQVRKRRPPAPPGVPEGVHALLLARAAAIEALTESPPRRFGPDAE